MTDLVDVLSEFMGGGSQPLGLVWPPRTDAPPLPDLGGRELALRRLKAFVARLPFMRTMQGPPQLFRVPETQIHVYQPDNIVELNTTPSISFMPARANNLPDDGWLGPSIEIEESADVYAPGTSLFALGEHIELITVEVVSDKHAIRRAILEGLKQVLRSSDDTAGLRLSLPAYFDQVATFTLVDTEYLDDPYVVQNRRKAHLYVELYMQEVGLFNTVTLRPYVQANVQANVSAQVRVSVSTT
jgi:hypothetical protein